jgi:hypothetical protein
LTGNYPDVDKVRPLWKAALFLDPRYKGFKLLPVDLPIESEQAAYDQCRLRSKELGPVTVRMVRREAKDASLATGSSTTVRTTKPRLPCQQKKELNVLCHDMGDEMFDTELEDNRATDDDLGIEDEVVLFETYVRQEMTTYRRAGRIPQSSNPFDWWASDDQQKAYPHLSRLALVILSIPATMASVERLFSSCGIVLSDLRRSLDPKRFEKMVRIKKNWDPELASIKKPAIEDNSGSVTTINDTRRGRDKRSSSAKAGWAKRRKMLTTGGHSKTTILALATVEKHSSNIQENILENGQDTNNNCRHEVAEVEEEDGVVGSYYYRSSSNEDDDELGIHND